MRLATPPPVLFLGTPDAVVPGGLVYVLPPWWPNWLRPAPVPIPVPPPVTPQTPHPDSEAVVEAMNRERAALGRARLAYDVLVAEVAQYWSQYQALHNTMTHGPYLNSSAQRIWTAHPRTWTGECVGEGYPDVPSLIQGLMGSPPHRAIILGNFTMAGAGVAYSRDGTSYWTLDVCRPA